MSGGSGRSGASVVAVAGPPQDPRYFDESKLLGPGGPDRAVVVNETILPTLPNPRTSGAEYKRVKTIFAVRMDRPFLVDTLNGPVVGLPGDYLATDDSGGLWPIKATTFERTYEPVQKTEKET